MHVRVSAANVSGVSTGGRLTDPAVTMALLSLHDVRIAYGGVAPKPWRASRAEAALKGKEATEENILNAAAAEFADAEPLEQNEYKVVLAKNLLKRAFRELGNV